MPNTWAIFPSVESKRGNDAAAKWKAQGYQVAVLVNDGKYEHGPAIDWLYVTPEYKGYWWATNTLVRELDKRIISEPTNMPMGKAVRFPKHKPDVYVLVADDIDPDPNHDAEEIANEYLEHFPGGFGVMQPCGDLQGEKIDGKHNAARICGSPWFGRGWMKHAFGGRYPVPDEAFHFYADELLYEVAKCLNVLWMREDLIQDHRHWAFGRARKTAYQDRNSRHWHEDKAWFMGHKRDDFKGYLSMFAKEHHV